MTATAQETTTTKRHTLRVVGKPELDRTFDPANATEVEETNQVFKSMIAQSYLGHNLTPGNGTDGEVTRTFDPEAETTVLRQPLVGG